MKKRFFATRITNPWRPARTNKDSILRGSLPSSRAISTTTGGRRAPASNIGLILFQLVASAPSSRGLWVGRRTPIPSLTSIPSRTSSAAMAEEVSRGRRIPVPDKIRFSAGPTVSGNLRCHSFKFCCTFVERSDQHSEENPIFVWLVLITFIGMRSTKIARSSGVKFRVFAKVFKSTPLEAVSRSVVRARPSSFSSIATRNLSRWGFDLPRVGGKTSITLPPAMVRFAD